MELAQAAAAQNSLNRVQSLLDADSMRVLNQIYDKLNDIDTKLNFVTEVLVNNNQLPNMMMPQAEQVQQARETSVIVPPVSTWLHHPHNPQVPTPPASLPLRKRSADVLMDLQQTQNHMRNDWLAHVLNDSIALAKRMRGPSDLLIHHPTPVSGGVTLPIINRDEPVINPNWIKPESTTHMSEHGDDVTTTTNSSAVSSAKTSRDDSELHSEPHDGHMNEQALSPPQPLPRAQSQQMPLDSTLNAQLGIYGKFFSGDAIRRAIEKAARSFDSTKPKVFAWQLLRESVTDAELPRVHISLRTFQGETADDLLNRQLAIVRNVVLATLTYFKWDQLQFDQRLVKTKIVLSHLKNNTKVRNWTLREGKSHRDRNSPEVLWRRYAAMLGPAGLAAAGLIATPDSTAPANIKPDSPTTPSSSDSP